MNTTGKHCQSRITPSCVSTSKSKILIKKKKTKKVYAWKLPSDKLKRPACACNSYSYLEQERMLTSDNDNRRPKYTAADVARAAESQLCDKPKRKHLKTHGMIEFTNISKTVASNWKIVNENIVKYLYMKHH